MRGVTTRSRPRRSALTYHPLPPSALRMPSPPDAIAIVNARIWTADERRKWADALLTRGDRIAAVGSSAEIMKRAGSAGRMIDADGKLVLPGFIDAHIHFLLG